MKKSKKKFKKYLETIANINIIIQSLWNGAKAALRRKCIATKDHFRKQEKSQINNLFLHLKELEKEGKKPKQQS